MRTKIPVALGLIASIILMGIMASGYDQGNPIVLEHYENVTVEDNVSVFIPIATLSAGVDNKKVNEFSQSIFNDVKNVLKSQGLKAEFWGEALNISIPGLQLPKPNGPVVIVFIPFYGREDHLLHHECYATVVLYMNSQPDLRSYYHMVARYSSGDGNLEHLTEELFKEAQTREPEEYSLKVVYWQELKFRNLSTSDERCWDALAGEIGKEVEGWAKTLKPSYKP